MSVSPAPRMANEAALKPVTVAAEKFGTNCDISPMSKANSLPNSSSPTTEMATGVVCRSVSPRRLAVTTISSSWALASPGVNIVRPPATSNVKPLTVAPLTRPAKLRMRMEPPSYADD